MADIDVDIVVAGAGAAGLSAAVALAHSGFSVACVGRVDVRENGRTVALFESSLRFYKALGLWPRLRAKAAPLAKIAMVDATKARFSAPTVSFAAKEIGLAAFGANIENNLLVEELAKTAAETLTLREELVEDVSFHPHGVEAKLAGGGVARAALIVAADGRHSIARSRAAIEARSWSYPQTALTALLSHEKPHRDVSTEFHTRSGPCTLVPLRPRGERAHRSSLVWLMTAPEAARRQALAADALAGEVEDQVESLLGRMEIEGSFGVFPMAGMSVTRLAGHRIALVGEAAHVFPPLAAQGLNLSLRDVAALTQALEDARASGQDIGSAEALAPYAAARRGDISLRTNGVDILNRSLLSEFAPVDLMRSAGFFAFSAIGPLRRALMREGVLTHSDLPRLMRAPPRRAGAPA